jgi:integrase
LSIVDRSSAQGKRDYAILLLACRLGLRVGDIRTLRLEQLRWDEARIEITQAKTGQPLSLPISEELGRALIDYLRHGRPASAHREVFLRLIAPFEPFGANNNLYPLISQYRRRAGIALPPRCRGGLHSLRHTLASRLLEQQTPLETISDILGHQRSASTRIYTKIDLNTLRTVALDPEEVHHA